jgi:hypothetical protein
MTEAEWLACTDPGPMLEFLRGKASDRKLRLFACAAVRRAWHCLTDERSRRAAEMAERYADGEATRKEVYVAWDSAVVADGTRWSQACPSDEDVPANAACWCAYTSERAAKAAWLAADGACRFLQHQDRTAHITLLRCIFGNPFRRNGFNRLWSAGNEGAVGKMAQAVYHERAFDRLPILADALEDAGCDNADILSHCRGPGPHVRGCWVVDLILGKS